MTTAAAAALPATADSSRRDAIAQAGETRSARIESLRAIAALGVLIGHVYAAANPLAEQRLATYFERISLGGGFGVYLFFALSGFLLFRPFAKRDVGGGAAIDVRRYALNRAVRILPLYYAAVVIMLVVTAHGGTVGQWLTFGLFAENFHDAVYVNQVDGVVWSLVVEVQFYVLLPLIALGVQAVARGSARRAALVLIAAGAASEALRWVLIHHGLDNSNQWRHAFPTSFVWFVPGMVLAVITVRRDAWPRRLSGAVLGSSTAWLAAAVAAWLLVFWNYNWDAAVLGACFLTVGACVLPLRAGRGVRALEWRGLAAVGVASYSLYMWHQPIVQRLPQLHWLPRSFWPEALFAVPLCLAIAAASYLLVERPFLRLRQRWSTDSAPIAPPR